MTYYNQTLTEQDIHEIRRLKAIGIPNAELAREFEVSAPTIGKYTYGVVILTPKQVYHDLLAEAA